MLRRSKKETSSESYRQSGGRSDSLSDSSAVVYMNMSGSYLIVQHPTFNLIAVEVLADAVWLWQFAMCVQSTSIRRSFVRTLGTELLPRADYGNWTGKEKTTLGDGRKLQCIVSGLVNAIEVRSFSPFYCKQFYAFGSLTFQRSQFGCLKKQTVTLLRRLATSCFPWCWRGYVVKRFFPVISRRGAFTRRKRHVSLW